MVAVGLEVFSWKFKIVFTHSPLVVWFLHRSSRLLSLEGNVFEWRGGLVTLKAHRSPSGDLNSRETVLSPNVPQVTDN